MAESTHRPRRKNTSVRKRRKGPAPPRTPRRFARSLLSALKAGKFVYVRAGSEHRFIGIWVVVVEERVFVRSWSLKPRSWYRAFLERPLGAITVGERELPVRARQIRSERINAAVDAAYLEKYNSRGSIKYARDLGSPKSRGTTTELMPR
jgi:hypothetical protein